MTMNIKAPHITVEDFEASFESRTDAAAALGVSRQTIWNWVTLNKGVIPDGKAWLAREIMRKKRK